MKLEDLGYTETFEKFRIENNSENFEVGRVIEENKERYIVRTENNEYEAEVTGNMRYNANGREDFPAVGDWVFLTAVDNDFAVIHRLFPRFSKIQRHQAGKSSDVQIIAANIDYALIVTAADRDFNLNRIERYLTICYTSKVEPIIVLTKTDLISENLTSEIMDSIKQRLESVNAISVSNETKSGYIDLIKIFQKGKTYCLLGSSGVGKSTLLNNLSGKEIMKTDTISKSTERGRHITTRRELILLEGGGLLIDNPGMREVGITDDKTGISETFDNIISLSNKCKFRDCKHTNEIGCAVLAAIESGELEKGSYDNFMKMERERIHYEESSSERKRKEKIFGKILKDYNKKDIKGRRGIN